MSNIRNLQAEIVKFHGNPTIVGGDFYSAKKFNQAAIPRALLTYILFLLAYVSLPKTRVNQTNQQSHNDVDGLPKLTYSTQLKSTQIKHTTKIYLMFFLRKKRFIYLFS